MRAPTAEELRARYEALRAQAVGEQPFDSPRGLTLVLTRGLPAWMWAQSLAAPSLPARMPASRPASAGRVEVVRLLTEMALGARAMVGAS
jgi:hypothetical protein